MKVLRMKKDGIDIVQYSNVSSIAYNSTTKIFTIIHSGGTATFSGDDYTIAILAQ